MANLAFRAVAPYVFAMRIIGGEFGGRKMIPPEGDQTRPITDRVKQSLFDILAPHIEGAAVYDCFAGTGSMGLECLSRGAAFCTFFEADRSTLARLTQNITALRVQDRTRIIPGDIFKWFERTNTRPTTAGAIGADLVFLDPPYRFVRDRPDELIQLAFHMAHLHLRPESILVFRHDAADTLDLPNLDRFDQREYGGMSLEFYRPVRAEAAEADSTTPSP